MRGYPFVTLDVFTQTRFGGNPLAVVTDARGLSSADMQALAAEFNFSETTFVLPPEDPAHTARVRIFNRTEEMPFAGHPNLGTAFVLGHSGLDRDGVLLFEEAAGLVEVRLTRDEAGQVRHGSIQAPQPLTTGPAFPADQIAACLGLTAADLVLDAHGPLAASVGVTFILVEVAAASLPSAKPNLAAFEALRERDGGLGRYSIFFYAHAGPGQMRARMFAPLSGTWEDPATGSANATLAALLVSLNPDGRREWRVEQGREIGRPSALDIAAAPARDGIRATVAGSCVEVARGWIQV